jgi:hypothetical protein
MKEKLLKLFEEMGPENQNQVLDYAMMLWEMEQGENQIKENLGIGKLKEEFDQIKDFQVIDPKNIN